MNELEQLAAQAAEAPDAVEAPQVEAQDAPDAGEVEAEAKRLGWKPRDEWKGDATNWTDAPAFLEYARNAPATVKRLATKLEAQEREMADRLARMERFAAEAVKRQQEAHAAELEAVRKAQRDAVSMADSDAFEAARKREDALRAAAPAPAAPAPAAVPPEVKEWAARNAWFDTDPEMKRAAVALAQKASEAGLGVTAQLAYVEREIGALFADRMKPAAPGRTFAAVDGGGLVIVTPSKRSRGWSDIPAAEREMIKRHHIGTVYKDEAEAAKSYWEMN